jgi:hypothetical protein
MFVIYEPWLFRLMAKPPQGMAIFPFILIQNKNDRHDNILFNHEKIHIRQQVEMLLLPFYILYGLNYAFNRLKYKNHDLAYRNVCFEREAYANEHNPFYLYERSIFSFWKYLFDEK